MVIQPLLVAYGAGTNSTAMLVGLHERGERPDAIVFADTGGERLETYAHVESMRQWCARVSFPDIVTVRHQSKEFGAETLEATSLRTGSLPSIAYGYRACSTKWKRDPQNAWARVWTPAVEAWSRGERVVKLIGFDADEPQRATRSDAASASDPTDFKRYTLRYPLIEWGWGREECVDAIARAGLRQPGKSSCFFCPMSKPREVLDLRDTAPDLFARALAIEDGARPFFGSIRGLGSRFSWRDLTEAEARQTRLFGEMPCGCYDGDDDGGAA